MRIDLIVIHTGRLEACHAFYTGLGLNFAPERHGTGPDHWAAVLGDGAVLELYPAGDRPATGRLRLGLTASGGSAAPGRHVLTDPDGRTVVLTVPGESAPAHGRP
ncbi:VOC family protein [Streptomyces sp. CAU 1734]|uniref:VOC family protein n=1 Tax=Streptomyces sp. CAU 1734 TaxID=3140360 RepID=UPI0032610813